MVECVDHIRKFCRRHRVAAAVGIARMVRQHDRMHRPHVMAEPLQGQHDSGIADMAVGDVRLDRKNVQNARPVLTDRLPNEIW